MNTIYSIGAYAFYACTQLKSITLNGINNIGTYTFAYCYSLSEVIRYFKRNGELKEAYKEIYKDMFKENNEFVALFFKFLTKDNDADLNESIKKFMTDEEIDKNN